MQLNAVKFPVCDWLTLTKDYLEYFHAFPGKYEKLLVNYGNFTFVNIKLQTQSIYIFSYVRNATTSRGIVGKQTSTK